MINLVNNIIVSLNIVQKAIFGKFVITCLFMH